MADPYTTGWLSRSGGRLCVSLNKNPTSLHNPTIRSLY